MVAALEIGMLEASAIWPGPFSMRELLQHLISRNWAQLWSVACRRVSILLAFSVVVQKAGKGNRIKRKTGKKHSTNTNFSTLAAASHVQAGKGDLDVLFTQDCSDGIPFLGIPHPHRTVGR